METPIHEQSAPEILNKTLSDKVRSCGIQSEECKLKNDSMFLVFDGTSVVTEIYAFLDVSIETDTQKTQDTCPACRNGRVFHWRPS